LFYSIHNNPSLRLSRKHFLESQNRIKKNENGYQCEPAGKIHQNSKICECDSESRANDEKRSISKSITCNQENQFIIYMYRGRRVEISVDSHWFNLESLWTFLMHDQWESWFISTRRTLYICLAPIFLAWIHCNLSLNKIAQNGSTINFYEGQS